MLRLHDNATSGNAYKVRLLLSQLGIPFERIPHSVDDGSTRTPEFLRRTNANGRIPVLELDDGHCLPESNAILWYLAEGTPFAPAAEGADRWARAQALQWMFFEQYSHEPFIATVRYWITHRVSMTHERVAALPGKRRQGLAALGVMEQHLERHAFFAGGRYSIADIALYAYTHVAPEGASTSARSRRCAPGSRASPRSRGTSRSPTERDDARPVTRPCASTASRPAA